MALRLTLADVIDRLHELTPHVRRIGFEPYASTEREDWLAFVAALSIACHNGADPYGLRRYAADPRFPIETARQLWACFRSDVLSERRHRR